MQFSDRAVVEFVPQWRVRIVGGCGGKGRMTKPRRVVIAIASRNVRAWRMRILLQFSPLRDRSFRLCGSNSNLSSCESSVCLSSSYGWVLDISPDGMLLNNQ